MLLTWQLDAQTPQGLNFQAIARDMSNNPILLTPLTVETGILSDTVANTYLWKETHAVTTNQFGLFSLVVGKGTKTGGTAGSFSAIDWTATPLYIRTKILYQSAWRDMGAATLWSVPYSMVAGNALAVKGDPVMINGSAVYILNNVGIGTNTPGTTKLAVQGDDSQSADALFEVKRKDGEVIFAVYNHGVRVNVPVDTLTKARKGGFAIGGFDKTKGIVQDYLIVNRDSIRMYISDLPSTKAKKGGFAIGGFDEAKSVTDEYLRVTRDSTRIYIDGTPEKGPKGGFAIGGFDESKASATSYLTINTDKIRGGKEEYIQFSPYNTYIGYYAGKLSLVTNPTYNTFIGYQSGYNNTSAIATFNTFIGHEAGFTNSTGTNNVFIGLRSGYQTGPNANNNVFIGKWSGYKTTGSDNVFIGLSSGLNNTSGNSNVFLGVNAGNANTTGFHNLFMAANAGQSNTTGNLNVALGYGAGGANQTGGNNVYIGAQAGVQNVNSNNIMIGTQAGFSNTNGTGNILIGYRAGYTETSSNLLIIDNGLKAKPLIWGDFNNARMVIAGNAADNVVGYTLYVNGTAGGDTPFTSTSDRSLKSNIRTIPGALEKVLLLRGVNFEWNDQALEPGTRMGLVAQEVQEVVPEVVNTNGDLLMLQYAPLTALLIEAVKEQEKKINSLEQQNALLTRQIEELSSLKSDIELLKAQVNSSNK